MRTFRALLLIFVASAVVAASSFGQTEKPPFTLTIKANKPTEVAGSQVFVWVNMTNISDRPVDCTEVEEDGTLVSYDYDVRDENAKPVDLWDKSLPYSGRGHTGKTWDKCSLGPGESRNIELIVSFRYDFSKPGKYVVQISRRASLDSKGFRTGEWVKSNAITITVVAPTPPGDAPQ